MAWPVRYFCASADRITGLGASINSLSFATNSFLSLSLTTFSLTAPRPRCRARLVRAALDSPSISFESISDSKIGWMAASGTGAPEPDFGTVEWRRPRMIAALIRVAGENVFPLASRLINPVIHLIRRSLNGRSRLGFPSIVLMSSKMSKRVLLITSGSCRVKRGKMYSR